jgi:holo-[acyl-carrier protein] synthase
MPVHVGIDLVDVADIEESLRRHGDHFLDRVYTADERAETRGRPAALAARFAAKEATMKALGRSDEGIGWPSIEVLTTTRSLPEIKLIGTAAELAATRGVTALRVGMTTRGRHAAAIVVAEAGR